MSDFIDHLIMRHLGTGEKVLPRSHALFETNVETFSLPVEDTVIKDFESIDQRRRQTVSQQTESTAASASTGNPEVNSSAAAISPELSFDRAAFASHKPDTGAMESPDSSPRHKSIHAAGKEDAQSFPGTGHPPIPSEIGKNPPESWGRLPGPEEQERLEKAHAANFSFYAAMNLPGQRARESVILDQGTLGTQVTPNVSARINPRQDKSLKEPAFHDPQTGTNRVINVSIGRIEVRATQPTPEMPQRREKPAGVMTLEQYLNRHSKGDNL